MSANRVLSAGAPRGLNHEHGSREGGGLQDRRRHVRENVPCDRIFGCIHCWGDYPVSSTKSSKSADTERRRRFASSRANLMNLSRTVKLSECFVLTGGYIRIK